MKTKRCRHTGGWARGAEASILGMVLYLGAAARGGQMADGFCTLDLRPVVNMAWRDEVAGDGKGGWSDQGRNDMREVEPGRKTLRGIPFDLIDPKANNGKAVLVLKSKNFANGVVSCRVPVDARAASLYFLHAAAWNRGHMATYAVHYGDGTGVEIPVRANQEIANWWRPKDGGSYRAALHVSNAECDDVGLVAFGWANPSPDKAIKELEFRSQNEAAMPIIAAVTLSQRPVSFADVKAAEPPADAAGQVLAAFHSPKADWVIKEVGQRLASGCDGAARVLEALAKDASPDAALARAELLLWIARGDETPSWARKDHKVRPQEMPTDELGRRAAALLEHGDPFVRGIAEWALATRLGTEYEGALENRGTTPSAKRWPDEDSSDWYRRWAAIGPESALELDYVRQAVALGLHRSAKSLLGSADASLKRARAIAERVEQSGDAERIRAVRNHMAELDKACRQLQEAANASPEGLTRQRQLWLAVRVAARRVVLDNPDLNFREILYGVRPSRPDAQNITFGRWTTSNGPGGDIYVQTGFSPTDRVRPLLSGRLGPGHVRGLDLWWDANRIVFAFARQPERGDWETSHLFEMNLDGTGLRQLTDARYNADQEPCYLPNGDIVFVSDRSNYGSQCAGAFEQDNLILNLYRYCRATGRIRPLSNNKDFDRHPHVMFDGRLLFLHWEYQERHLWQTHTLWTCRPDGTATDAIFKQHIPSGPMSLREARQVWGLPLLVAIACGHHNSDQGAVMLTNYSRGINTSDAMRLVTPGVSGTEGGYGRTRPVEEGGVQDNGGHYMFPHPLSDRSFLVAYSYKRPERLPGHNFALYYIDVWGNKELIRRDKKLSVAFLMPLRPTPRPPTLPETEPREPQAPQRFATVYMSNVHADLPGVKPGTVRYLRICHKTPWPCVRDASRSHGFNDLHWVPAGTWTNVFGYWDWGPARVIGTVPVEEDGSAYFKVPVDQAVYFQALDKDLVEVRRMRSNVTFQAGEVRSCIGCHETRPIAPPAPSHGTSLALRHAPSMPEPPPWGDRELPDYERHVQPLLDRHCVRCHGEKDPKGGLEFTARRVGDHVQSYRTLFGLKPSDPTPVAPDFWEIWHAKEPMPCTDETARAIFKQLYRNERPGQLVTIADRFSGSEVTPPLAFGSGGSKLIRTLLNDPEHQKEVKMSREEWSGLVTWIDLNAQYYGTFVDKDPYALGSRAGGRRQLPRRVRVVFPDPWTTPPSGEWTWQGEGLVVLSP